MTVADLLDSLGKNELVYWLAYQQIEPFLPAGNAFQPALMCATFANYNAWGLKRPKQPADFMPRKRRDPASPELLEKQWLVALGAMGKRPERAK